MKTTTYQVIYDNICVRSKASLSSKCLGKLNKGDTIEIINSNYFWAKFRYKGKIAYILTFNIKKIETITPEVKGSVTINYLDKNSKEKLATSTVYSNLTLGSYTYNAIPIANHNILDNTSQSVTLTKEQPNQTITFLYSKIILGQITINYIDKDSKAQILASDLYTNLELKEYTYDAKDIKNYKVYGNSSISVILTQDNQNQTITFEYEKEFEVLPIDIEKQNEVPYISTYYIKPTVKPDEEVIIDYYITDYYHKEYVNEDYSELFTVTVRVEGKDDIVVKGLKAGDHSISLGSFPELDGVEQKFSILCTDQYGRNSHELFNFFLVRNDVPVKEYVMTEEDLVTYNISNANDTTKISDTREGLQKLLDDKQLEGYNKLKLLEGTYRINHIAPIYIPTRFTLDMNGATLKLHEFTGDTALMIELNNTFDSHVINGIIEGDRVTHNYANSSNNSEWVNGISIGGESKYSSYENLTIKDITGYGAGNGLQNSRDGKLSYFYIYPKSIGATFKLGDINRLTGLDISSTNRTTCDFQDISGYSDVGYLTVSRYLGYQGIPCNTWNLVCHFYNSNKEFIKSIDTYQYRRIAVPPNTKYMRVTILEEAYPSSLSIQYFRVPTHCAFKNIKFENCRCVGLAQSAMNNMLVDSCEFTKCGTNSAKCAYDAEDGWDMMQDVTFRRLNFHDNPNNEFLTCAGHNFIVENHVNGNIYTWPRTKDFVIRNSNCNNLNLDYSDIVQHGIYRIYNNTVIDGYIGKNIARNITVKESMGGIIHSSTMSKLPNYGSGNVFYDCTIKVCSEFIGYTKSIEMYNCNFILDSNFNSGYKISFNENSGNSSIFKNCHFYGKCTLANHNNFLCGNFNNCIFDDMNLEPSVVAKESDEIVFTDCTINSTSSKLIVYSPFNYTQGQFTKITFNNCTITNIVDGKVFAYGIAEPANGFLKLNNCTLNIPNLSIFFDCYNNSLSYIQNFNIILSNTQISKNVSILSKHLEQYHNSNIFIKIS